MNLILQMQYFVQHLHYGNVFATILPTLNIVSFLNLQLRLIDKRLNLDRKYILR